MRLVLCLFASISLSAQSEPPPKFREAVEAQQRGEYDRAIAAYREILKSSPKLVPAWMNLGVSLVQEKQWAEAIESYQKALALDPGNSRIQSYLALAYFKSGAAVQAVNLFERLLRDDPKDIHIATLLAASDLQAGKATAALAVLEPLASEAADDSDFLWALATAQAANGKLHASVDSAEKVGRKTNSAEAWKLAGENLLRLNEFPRGRQDLETAVGINQELPGLQTVLGQAREKNADYDSAIVAFQKAVQQNPKDFDAWLGLGSDQYFIRDLAGAADSLHRALSLNGDSAPALYALALVDKSRGKSDAAIIGLEKAVKLEPNWIEAHAQLATLYVKAQRPADGAREREIVDRLNEIERKAGPAQ